MPDNRDLSYINSTDYKTLETRVTQLRDVMDDLNEKLRCSRKLRYTDIDVEAEREAGRLQPDELLVPQHIIDTNIRREQSPYVQYITQSPRAVILEDDIDPTVDLSLLEKDLTKKLRFDGWQLSQFANIDGFQMNGYGVMELIQDQNQPGEVAHEAVQYGDFSFLSDTRDIQACEMLSRSYYYTKTRLVTLCGDGTKLDEDWNKIEVEKVISQAPKDNDDSTYDGKDRSLYKIYKVMFRVGGVVHVAWACPEVCNDWLRKPRPLYLGRRRILKPSPLDLLKMKIVPSTLPPSSEDYETAYPYFLFPYIISENDTISHLKGRVYLDETVQEAVSSLTSSAVTQARRAAGLYGSRDSNDPNDDILMERNIYLRSGCILNSKVSFTQLEPPDPGIFNAINLLVAANQNETSQLNFAVNNRKDSRKTAEEIKTASQQAAILSTVQVVLFSIALKNLYTSMCAIIKSRVLARLIEVNSQVRPLYNRKFKVKPSGDTDVIEKQQLISTMMTAWAVIQNTPAASAFLSDMIEKMFPENSAKYLMAFQQAAMQAQSAQAQQQKAIMGGVMTMAQSIIELSKHKDWFSDLGQLHALPRIMMGAQQLEQLQQQIKQLQTQQPQAQ